MGSVHWLASFLIVKQDCVDEDGEQIFPIWTKISVNKSFIVYIHK